jgi:hypothetical protein
VRQYNYGPQNQSLLHCSSPKLARPASNHSLMVWSSILGEKYARV